MWFFFNEKRITQIWLKGVAATIVIWGNQESVLCFKGRDESQE